MADAAKAEAEVGSGAGLEVGARLEVGVGLDVGSRLEVGVGLEVGARLEVGAEAESWAHHEVEPGFRMRQGNIAAASLESARSEPGL